MVSSWNFALLFVVFIVLAILLRRQNEELSHISYRHERMKSLTNVDLGLVWLLHYPKTGARFTNRLVQRATQYTVATNYGPETFNSNDGVPQEDSRPVYATYENSPFRSSGLKLPPRYILTNTECTRFHPYSKPDEYVPRVNDPAAFETACRSGQRYLSAGGRREDVTYDSDLVEKVVHLTRNPFDVVVSRFRHELKMRAAMKDVEFVNKYPDNPDGFQMFCRDLDGDDGVRKMEMEWYEPQIFELVRDVPCHAEFYRYLKFVNMGFKVADDLGVPEMILRYEDYRSDQQKTTDKLLEFLDVKRRFWKKNQRADLVFNYHGGYAAAFYDSTQLDAIKEFVMAVSIGKAATVMNEYMASVRVIQLWRR